MQDKKKREGDKHENEIGNACPNRVDELKGFKQEVQMNLFPLKITSAFKVDAVSFKQVNWRE